MSNQTGYTPIQIQTAYGINQIQTPSNKPCGYGIKIAVISCYHYSNLQYDLNTYCKKYKLTPITLKIINQAGNTRNNDFALIINSAVQMINTVAPGATVYVVEAKSNSINDIFTALETAVNLGVNIISMPFGAEEFSKQSSYEYLFLNSNISFICATGDSHDVLYPASSTNVLAVGGTNLTLKSNNTRNTETNWSDSGSGTSLYSPKPNYQNSINSSGYRNTPDVSLLATPGAIVYCSILGGYYNFSETAVSCNLMAGIIAICNQLRKAISKPMLTTIATSPNCIQTYLYNTIYNSSSLYSSTMYDIKSGSTNVGYDITTGLGSINANEFCNQLVNL